MNLNEIGIPFQSFITPDKFLQTNDTIYVWLLHYYVVLLTKITQNVHKYIAKFAANTQTRFSWLFTRYSRCYNEFSRVFITRCVKDSNY